MKSTQQTIDMTVCIERSTEKNGISSPSPVKPPDQQSPSPRINFVPVMKKLNFDEVKHSPLFRDVKKRKSSGGLNTQKKKRNGNLCRAYVEFFDPEIGDIQRFICFPDKVAVENQEVTKKLTQNECDDDCATSKEVKGISKQYLIEQVSKALVLVGSKRNTI